MTKEELIISEKYDLHCDIELNNLYLSLYSIPNQEPFTTKLHYLFCYYHSVLNLNLQELNRRINGNKYYRAGDSRDLISIIDEIHELQKLLSNTIYEFKIENSYSSYMIKTRSYLQETFGTQIPEDVEPITIIKYEKIFAFSSNEDITINLEDDTNKIIQLISTRNASFVNMAIDEKLEVLNKALEFLLKGENGKFKKIDEDKLFKNLVSNALITQYRKMTHCFRHGSKESLEERKVMTENQKDFIVNYGLTICDALIKEFYLH